MTVFYITCPWCKTQYHQTVATNCVNCGGTLPHSEASGGAGQAPPPAPRVLPKSYVRRVKYFNNVYTMIGIIFTIPFIWSVIFPIIGIFMWRKGLRDAEGELLPLEIGAHVQGEITNVYQDTSKKINGKSPWVVEFVFQAHGRPYAGDVPNIMDPVHLWRKPGDKIWVVYLHDNPEMSSIWPPMK